MTLLLISLIFLILFGLHREKVEGSALMPLSPLFFSLSCFILSTINILIISATPPIHSKPWFIALTALMVTLVAAQRRRIKRNIRIELVRLRCLFDDSKESFIALESLLTGKIRSGISGNYSVLMRGLLGLVAVQTVLAVSLPVTNGDAQLYNLSRVSASIISGTFPPAGGNQYQSYYEYAHDYIYAPDLVLGNITGLGIVCLAEWLFCLVAVTWITRRAGTKDSKYKTAICLILFVSWPVGVFQAISVKNDLCIALYCLVLYQVVASRLDWKKEWNRDAGGEFRKGLGCLYALSIAFLLLISKGYGFIGIIAVIAPWLCTLIAKAKRSTRITSRNIGSIFTRNGRRLAVEKFFSPSSYSFHAMPIILIATIVGQVAISSHFIYTNKSVWNYEYSVMRRSVSTDRDFISLSTGFTVNSARYLVEGLFHAPIPSHSARNAISSYSSRLPIVSSDVALRQGYFDKSKESFRVSNYFGEDIAWPAPVITVLSILGLAVFTRIHWKNYSSSEPLKLYLSSAILMLSLASALKWSPYNVRYFTCVYFLAIPFLGKIASGTLRERHEP